MEETRKNAQKVVDLLKKAKSKCLTIMEADEMLKLAALGLETTISQLINRISHQVGLPPENETGAIVFENLKPGSVVPADEVQTAEVSGDDLEQLNAAVEKAAAVIGSEDTAVVLERYRTNTELLALRALAKKVGVPEYDTAAIDAAFVDAIREKLTADEQTQRLDKAATLALIEAAEDEEKIKQLAASFNDDEDIQNAAMNRLIALEK